MKNKYIVGALLGVLLVGLGTALYARAQWSGGPFGFGGHRDGERLIAHLARKLDLTTAQQTEVKQLWQSEKPMVTPLVQQLAQLNKQMVQATAGGSYDQAKVAAIANQESQVISALILEKEKLTSKFYTLLTPEQRTRFDAMQQRRLERIDRFVQHMTTEQSK